MLCTNVVEFTVRISTNLLQLSSRASNQPATCCTISASAAGSNAGVHILLAVLLFFPFFYCKLMQKTPRVEIKLSAALCKMACTVQSSETDY